MQFWKFPKEQNMIFFCGGCETITDALHQDTL